VSVFSKVVRRTHMYLALFLTPWTLMYALSTFVMNHRDLFRKRYGGNLVAWQKESERAWTAPLKPGVDAQTLAAQILRDLQLDGGHTVNKTGAGITIVRQDQITPRRIT
jgi:hypothetical protein